MESSTRAFPAQTAVLIVGGGPAGLTAALLLARQGIQPLLVERRGSTSIHPRARGLNVRTMEIYRSIGLEPAVQAAGAALAKSTHMLFVETLAGREIRRVLDEDLVTGSALLARVSPSRYCQCAQDELEPLLVTAAREHGADLRFGVELVSFTQDADGVSAVVRERASGAEWAVRAAYLIAADGANSSVGRMLGMGRVGRGVLGRYVNIYVRAELGQYVEGREFGICFVETPAAPGLFLAVNNTDRWLFNVEYAPETGASSADFTPERCIALVRAAAGLPQLDVEVLSILPWEASASVVERMQVGRVFLMGDAAHTMPPSGGFGLNTGVHDAHNLAWKLAAVLRGEADASLLASYDQERRPVVQMIVEAATRELEHGEGDGPPAEAEESRDDAASVLAVTLGYRYISQAVVQMAESAAASEDGAILQLDGAPGTRAPHHTVLRAGQRLSTLDLFDGRFTLLTGAEDWRRAAQAVAARRGVAFAVYRVGEDPAADLRDADGDWAAIYGIAPEGATLVRPDGFVAWRSATSVAQPELALDDALTQVLGQ